MTTCSQCSGEGYVEYEEDEYCGRYLRDVCYHCSGSGKISFEEKFQDELAHVATALAHFYVSQRRKAIDSDPDGDGLDLIAAENMMSSFDYFHTQVLDKQSEFYEKLLEMPFEAQELLIAWNNV